jgi:hypothetical protein
MLGWQWTIIWYVYARDHALTEGNIPEETTNPSVRIIGVPARIRTGSLEYKSEISQPDHLARPWRSVVWYIYIEDSEELSVYVFRLNGILYNLKMDAESSSETSTHIYRSTQCHTTEILISTHVRTSDFVFSKRNILWRNYVRLSCVLQSRKGRITSNMWR